MSCKPQTKNCSEYTERHNYDFRWKNLYFLRQFLGSRLEALAQVINAGFMRGHLNVVFTTDYATGKHQKRKFLIYTAEPPNSHTPKSHTYPNSHTLFGLTKMWLFGYVKDFKRKISQKSSSRWANHLLFLKNGLIQDWTWGCSGNFCSSREITNAVFLNQKNSNLESLPTMRNPPSTQIVTKYPYSHTYPNSHTFFGFMKMWRFGSYTVFMRSFLNITWY